eukprot:CAMPEP_0197653856 /NCGR_PEP_ID=MMETSP1338-20131121/37408_1 /TAXON_ID=43686 ORGANISM="Pelagodinium beii, Strain RCC1491" /NCGR_SAMPLE_ID=MMETSP1338 /ASSEMBLY_ACC=CAM_ASM_000754 /LENGTH=73 /DNA_ID=CAMNT_0043229117 /DNA_START=281 /DNA_END=502 /DNA_ORIENTATION=-
MTFLKMANSSAESFIVFPPSSLPAGNFLWWTCLLSDRMTWPVSEISIESCSSGFRAAALTMKTSSLAIMPTMT